MTVSIQVLTTLAFVNELPFPSHFRGFLSWLNWASLDPVRYTSAQCLTSVNFVSLRVASRGPT